MRREKKDQILAVLPEKIRGILLNHGLDFEKIQEIRLREEQPLAVKKEGKEELFTHRVTKEELRESGKGNILNVKISFYYKIGGT